MRLSLDPRRGGSQAVDGCAGRPPAITAPERNCLVAASETVTLVLGEDSPVPETAAGVEDLARCLRGHVAQLGARTEPGTPALLHAQQLCSNGTPEGFMPSRVYLVKLAEATQELTACVERGASEPISLRHGQRWRRPTVNVLRGVVFAVALACVVLAASVPRP
ncbi:DUF6415 family natural product biosynthesis protein [Streptomyces sp. NPDC001414]